MRVTVNGALQQQILRQMEASYPNEGGGFLLGSTQDGSTRIIDIIQIDNVFEEAEQYHRYAMRPQDWANLEDQADERGLSLVGYYHSHPNAPAVPSVYDRDHALPNFAYLITSVEDGAAVDMRVWRLRGDRSQFDAGELIVQD